MTRKDKIGLTRSCTRCNNWAGPTAAICKSCSGASTLGVMLQVSRAVPVVFVGAADPVGAGFVESLGRPGGNATGFTSYEYSMSAKWLELLKEIAPAVKRVAVL